MRLNAVYFLLVTLDVFLIFIIVALMTISEIGAINAVY